MFYRKLEIRFISNVQRRQYFITEFYVPIVLSIQMNVRAIKPDNHYVLINVYQ